MPTPVIIGVSDIKNPSLSPADAKEPVSLILSAIHAAISDTSTTTPQTLISHIDSLSIVRTWTWPYPDLPSLLADRLGISPQFKTYTDHGGNSPAKILDETARLVSAGSVRVGVIAGGEALASLAACAKEGLIPPEGWTEVEGDMLAMLKLDLGKRGDNIGTRHAAGLPIHVYPMYENGFRARHGQSIKDNHGESARLYAEFAKIAAGKEAAWNYGKGPATELEIATVGKGNRMICFPYPLLMNAFNNVNLAAAAIVTSVEVARELGVPERKWIYPLGGAGTKDSEHFWERPDFYSSPSISRALDAALSVSGLSADDIDLFDIYSCFPIVPKLACEHLGIPLENPFRPITLLGGLTSFGGAGNNYSMHAITEMARQLRDGPAKNGLILANGGTLTYQYAVCLSKHVGSSGQAYPSANPLPEKITDIPIPKILEEAEGEAVIETYTVEYKRNGEPSKALIVGRLVTNSSRFVANDGDANTLRHLTSQTTEAIGRRGLVRHDRETRRNLFILDGGVKL